MSGSISPLVRQKIQSSTESIRTLARQYNISPATVQKWRNRTDTTELRRGPKPGQCTAVPDYVEEASVLFRQQTLLPLDDCLYALRIGNPTLSRATLHRYFRKWGLGSLAAIENVPTRRKSQSIGFVHFGLMHVRIQEGDVVLLNGFDRVSKYTYGSIVRKISEDVVAEFVQTLCDHLPFRIHTLQTSNSPLFQGDGSAFTHACVERGIFHHIVAPPPTIFSLGNSPVNGAEEGPHDFDTLEDVQKNLQWQIARYNSNCKLKSLGGLSPSNYIEKHAERHQM